MHCLFNDVRNLEHSTRDYVKHAHKDVAGRYLVTRPQDNGYFNREIMNTFAHNDISMQLNIANLLYQF